MDMAIDRGQILLIFLHLENYIRWIVFSVKHPNVQWVTWVKWVTFYHLEQTRNNQRHGSVRFILKQGATTDLSKQMYNWMS